MPTPSIVKRLISSVIILSVVTWVIFKGNAFVFFLFVELFALVALYEFAKIMDEKGVINNLPFFMVLGAVIPVFFSFSAETVSLSIVIVALFIYHFKNHEVSSLLKVAFSFFGLIYIVWFFSFMIQVHLLDQGPQWVAFLILVTKIGDAGAYFVGTRFGKRKLMEAISPNKTVEGAVGGLLTSIVLAVLSAMYLHGVSVFHLGAIGFFLSLLAQLGDLSESLLKREVGVKDSGVVPGLGGILDILDSLLFTTPFLYFYLTNILGVT